MNSLILLSIHPDCMPMDEIKSELKSRNMRCNANKEVLISRLILSIYNFETEDLCEYFNAEELARTWVRIRRMLKINKCEDELYKMKLNHISVLQNACRNFDTKFDIDEYMEKMNTLEGMKYFIPRSDWLIYSSSSENQVNQKVDEVVGNKDLQRYIGEYL